jgi:hypothetical protein
MYFASAKSRDEDEADSDVRELRVMKSNYGPAGEVVRLCWQRGVFVPVGSAAPLQQIAAEADIERAYLDCLDALTAQGRQVSPNRSSAFAPTVFEAMPQARGYRAKALGAAQERLFAAGRIQTEASGPPSKRRERITRKVFDGMAEAAQ